MRFSKALVYLLSGLLTGFFGFCTWADAVSSNKAPSGLAVFGMMVLTFVTPVLVIAAMYQFVQGVYDLRDALRAKRGARKPVLVQ